MTTATRRASDSANFAGASSPSPCMQLHAVDDAAIAVELDRAAQAKRDVLVAANAYTVVLLTRDNATAPWSPVACGEFGVQSQAASRRLRGRLYWADVEEDPREINPATVSFAAATPQGIAAWIKKANSVTGVDGRQGDIRAKDKDLIGYQAAWRCQFPGCGQDLRWHEPTGTVGQFGYFAHIVASSPDGPRGDPIESPKLASDPTNFLLLCDACHRRIDKVEPHSYPAAVLRKMREDNIAEVKRLLSTLRYPEASVIAVIGNIAGQPAQFSLEDAYPALRGRHLRTADLKPQRFFDPGVAQHDVHDPAYWVGAFRQLRQDLVSLQGLLNGSKYGSARPRLAVFPQHSTSILILAGRVLGDTSGVEVFQPHRNAAQNSSRWAWPEEEANPLRAEKFNIDVMRHPSGKDSEAILILGLTFDISLDRLPAECVSQGRLRLPTVRISTQPQSPHCIRTPKDLEELAKKLDEVMLILQDDWRSKRVHVFAGSPASSLVVLGQKMQARHQADYVIYESPATGAGAAFRPTIELTSKVVRELVSGNGHSQPLQP